MFRGLGGVYGVRVKGSDKGSGLMFKELMDQGEDSGHLASNQSSYLISVFP